MIVKNSQGLWEFQLFKKIPKVIQAISSKEFGDTKFDQNFKVNANFEKVLKKLNPQAKYVLFQQVHLAKITVITNTTEQKVLKGVDGGVTILPSLFLAVFVADCFPILAFDPISGIIGAAHAGWKGIKAEIADNLISKMKSLGANPKNIVTGIGPGICLNHYEVQGDVAVRFDEKFLKRLNDKIFLDLEKVIISQLRNCGVKKENIEKAGVCVFESHDFFSYRREKENLAGEQVVLIGLKG